MSNNKNGKKRSPVLAVVIFTIIAMLLAGGCIFGLNAINSYKAKLLADRQAEVQSINQEREDQYALEMADFEAQTSSGANLAWPAQSPVGWDVVNLDNYPLENATPQRVTRQEALTGGMLLVNEWHSRPDDFSEQELVSVSTASEHKVGVKDGNVVAFPAAIGAMRACVQDAKELGYENYVVWEGYRSWETQNNLFQNAMAKHSDQYSGEDLVARTKKDVNYPGTSEFNSGLTMTVRLYKRNDAEVNNKAFFESDEGIWMYENSWRYGLVFRFPLADYPVKGTADKSYKTGVGVQLRAFRYVGPGNAAAMHTLDLCLEEYVEYLMEHPHIAVFEDGVLKYEIYREYVGDAAEFNVTVVGSGNVRSWSTSLDNMGYAITVCEY